MSLPSRLAVCVTVYQFICRHRLRIVPPLQVKHGQADSRMGRDLSDQQHQRMWMDIVALFHLFMCFPPSLSVQEYVEREEVLKLRAAGLKKVYQARRQDF